MRTAADAVGGRVIVVDRARPRCSPTRPGRGLAATSYASRPEIRAALAGGVSQGTRHSASLGEDLLFTAVPIVEGGRRAGAVRMTQRVDAVRSEVRSDTLALVGLGLAALALGLDRRLAARGLPVAAAARPDRRRAPRRGGRPRRPRRRRPARASSARSRTRSTT